MQIDKSSISLATAVGVAAAVVFYALQARTWADNKHTAIAAEAKAETEKVEELTRELIVSNALLKQIQVQQADLIKEASGNAKQNRESLIRLEDKLGTAPEETNGQ